MILTNKHINLSKNKVVLIILFTITLILFFSTESGSLRILKLNNVSSYDNSREEQLLDLSVFHDIVQAISNDGSIESNSLKNMRILVILMIALITILTYLTLFFLRRNITLVKEALQIKSELNQYIMATTSEEDLKLSQDEARRQALMLNERQQEIVDLMAFGLSNKQIADKLFISENTVKYHIKNIYQLLHVKDRKALWLSQS